MENNHGQMDCKNGGIAVSSPERQLKEMVSIVGDDQNEHNTQYRRVSKTIAANPQNAGGLKEMASIVEDNQNDYNTQCQRVYNTIAGNPENNAGRKEMVKIVKKGSKLGEEGFFSSMMQEATEQKMIQAGTKPESERMAGMLPQVIQKQAKRFSKSDVRNATECKTIAPVNILDKSKRIFEYKNGRLYCNGIPKGNFGITIHKIYEYCDNKTGECVESRLDIELHIFQSNGAEKIYFQKNIRQEDVCAKGFLNRFPGAVSFCGSPTETANFLYQYLSWLIYVSGNLNICRLYKNAGWIKDAGRHMYLTADGAVGHPELNARAVSELHIANSSLDSISQEFCKMLSIIREAWKSMGLILYVMMQFLHSVFETAGAVPKFVLFLSGPRGCRKTAVCQCMVQLVRKDTPAVNFLATEAGIQNQLARYRDQCILIDDLAPTSDRGEKKRKEKMLEMVLRLFGDSGERVINPNFTPGAADKTDYSVHGGAVLTGEYFYSAGSESSIARAVVIELNQDSVNLEVLSYFQNNPSILESLLYRLILYVTDHYMRVLQIIRDNVLYYRDYARQIPFSNGRYADYLAQYMATAHIVAEMFVQESGIDGNQYHQFIHYIEKGIVMLLLENNEKLKQRAPIHIILSALLFAISSGKIGEWGMSFGEGIRLVQKEGTVYFRQMDLSDITREYCQKLNIPHLRMSSNEIGKILDSSGLFHRYGSDKRLGRRYVTVYGNERLIDISLEKLKRHGEDYCVDL